MTYFIGVPMTYFIEKKLIVQQKHLDVFLFFFCKDAADQSRG